ncbi:hypothetical protein, partial [Mesorhizobium ciceri]|uniref:hypothetical protein n=1 Tax=Mesorhizobium ciceri TaxID=39645 RepID=UPI001AEBAE1E
TPAPRQNQSSPQNQSKNSPHGTMPAGPLRSRGWQMKRPSRRHDRINRTGGRKDKAIRSSCQASVMPVMTCNQIRNEFGRGGVLFSRLFMATLGHDND